MRLPTRSLCTIVAAAICCLATPSFAGWNVSRGTDPMTDTSTTVATLQSKNLPAIEMRLTCRGPEILFPVVPTYAGRLDMAFRFDDGPVTPRFVVMSSDRKAALLWLSNVATLSTVAKAKRFRAEIFVIGAPTAFVDFDLAGSGDAVRALGCR